MEGFMKNNKAASPVPWGWWDMIIIVAIMVSSLYLVQMFLLIGNRFQLVSEDTGMTSPFIFISIALIYGLLIGCVYWFAVRRGEWAAIGIKEIPWNMVSLTPFLLVAEMLGIIGMNGIVERFTGPFENPQIDALSTGGAFTTTQLIMLLLLIAILAPIAEEFFFRGMLYPLLRQWGSGVAIVGSAALFAMVHFIPILFPSLFFVGLILGLLREYSKSTIPCIVLHMMQNGTMILLLHLSMQSG